MRLAPILLALAAIPAGAAIAAAQPYESEYTTRDHETDCQRTVVSVEGAAYDLLCPGIGDYTYFLRSTDGRESVLYGFNDGGYAPTFGRFNYANGTVEWRIAAGDPQRRPVAAIQRWFLADIDGNWATQILVVSKVGQPEDREACVVGFVDASDGGAANERARLVADTAAGFDCASDAWTVEPGIAEFVPQQETGPAAKG